MSIIKKINVSIQFDIEEIEVGELISEGKEIYFKYYADFIERGIEISPIKTKLSSQIYKAPSKPFEGLFGVFADSISDGWGRLLFDKALTSKGISIEDIGPLDRLSHVGTRGMGALIYRPVAEGDYIENFTIELDTIAYETDMVLQGMSSEVIEELYNLGGSSGGARPKILVGYNPGSNELIHGIHRLPKGFEHWMIKFPASSDPKDMSNIEWAYYQMAKSAGIEMSECKLFTGSSGKTYFATKRFDRINNQKLHLHSAAGLLNDDFRLSSIDYGHLMDAAFILEKHISAHQKVLRLAAFNVFAHNRDDHSKNFSFLMDVSGTWKMSPAYDLTFSNSSHGYHSTSIAGNSIDPGKEDLLKLAKEFSITNANEIIDEVQASISKWKKISIESGVSTQSQKRVSNYLTKKN